MKLNIHFEGFSRRIYKKKPVALLFAPLLWSHSSLPWFLSLRPCSFSPFIWLESSIATVLSGSRFLKITKRQQVHQRPLKLSYRAQNYKLVRACLRFGQQTLHGAWGSPTTCTTIQWPQWSLGSPPFSLFFAFLPPLLSQSFCLLKRWWWHQLLFRGTDQTTIWQTDRQGLGSTWSTERNGQEWIWLANNNALGMSQYLVRRSPRVTRIWGRFMLLLGLSHLFDWRRWFFYVWIKVIKNWALFLQWNWNFSYF